MTVETDLTEILNLLATIDRQTRIVTAAIDQYEPADSLADARSLAKSGHIPYWAQPPSTEQWQQRERGKADYLYLTWGFDNRTGNHRGPNGRRKVYIGSAKPNIDLARQLTANHHDRQKLLNLQTDLTRVARTARGDVERVRRLLEHAHDRAQDLLACTSTTQS